MSHESDVGEVTFGPDRYYLATASDEKTTRPATSRKRSGRITKAMSLIARHVLSCQCQRGRQRLPNVDELLYLLGGIILSPDPSPYATGKPDP